MAPHSLVSDKSSVIHSENYQSESHLEPAACKVLLDFLSSQQMEMYLKIGFSLISPNSSQTFNLQFDAT
jgi:hypothetical protein